MKKFLILLLATMSLIATTDSFAHGWHGGGYRGGYGYGFGVAPFWAGAVIGGAVVSSTYSYPSQVYYSTPTQVVSPQPIYVQPQQAYVVQPHAYYCATSQNYYPTVQTCNVPWQQINWLYTKLEFKKKPFKKAFFLSAWSLLKLALYLNRFQSLLVHALFTLPC